MARQVNGFVGNFTSLTDLTTRFPPSEYAGCSANFIINGITSKYWSNGTVWAGADAAALQALVSGDGKIPTLAWALNGTRSVPVSTFLGASTNGLFGVPSPILIPAAQIAYGKSVTEIEATIRKTGTGTGGWALKMGSANGLGDADIHPAVGSSFSATDPQEYTLKFRLTYSAGLVHVVGERRVSGSTAPLTETKETAVTLTGDNYINLALNSFAAGTNVALISLSVRHFL